MMDKSEICPITGLTKDKQKELAFLASWLATECRLALNGKRLDDRTQEVYAWIDESVIPVLQKSDNEVIQTAVNYFGDRSYGRKHLLYLWHLLQEEEERATQSPFVTFEVFQILMRGDLEELSVPYEKVMDEYGL
jgi:hypothetical protein